MFSPSSVYPYIRFVHISYVAASCTISAMPCLSGSLGDCMNMFWGRQRTGEASLVCLCVCLCLSVWACVWLCLLVHVCVCCLVVWVFVCVLLCYFLCWCVIVVLGRWNRTAKLVDVLCLRNCYHRRQTKTLPPKPFRFINKPPPIPKEAGCFFGTGGGLS